MNYAYTDSSNDLVALDTNNKNLTLVQVKVICPTAANKIDNVPAELKWNHKFTDLEITFIPKKCGFFRHISGDGTDISHWSTITDTRTYGIAL